MIVNRQNLDALRVGFKTNFQAGLLQHTSMYTSIATVVPSTTREEKYGWLGKVPKMREWIGDRVVQNLMEHDYAVKNKDWELTIGVDRNDIDDDILGIYKPLFEEMGRSTQAHPDELVFGLLKDGFSKLCYDGQFFFDTDHPVLDEKGVPQSVSNFGGGAGTPWFLMDASRAIKPIIFQERKKPQFVMKDALTDENVFRKKQFEYGVDSRDNVGFGFWQFAFGSKDTLNAANYAAARAAITGMKGDFARPLGLMPTLLVVPPALESAGLKLLNSEYAAGGETNEWKGTAKLMMTPWLA